jgi:hypothetical protein
VAGTTGTKSTTGTRSKSAKKDTGGKSRCDEGGAEILTFRVLARAADVVLFTMTVCKANARIRVWLTPLPDGAECLVVDETGKDEVSAQLTPLTAGEYLLRWSILTPSDKWQTKTELSVGGDARFRWRKQAASDNPVKGGTLLLVVA